MVMVTLAVFLPSDGHGNWQCSYLLMVMVTLAAFFPSDGHGNFGSVLSF